MGWINAADFARRVRCSRAHVTQSIRRGKIAPEYLKRDGRNCYINTAAVDDWLAAARNGGPAEAEHKRPAPPRAPAPASRSAKHQEAPMLMWGKSATTATAERETEREQLTDELLKVQDAAGQTMGRAEAERQIAVLRLRLLELDLAEREGQLVEVEAMQKVVFEQGRRVRDLLMGIPVRIAADLAAENDPAGVSILLEKALVEALEGLSDAVRT